MRGSGPAAGAAGVLAGSWALWELWKVFWMQDLNLGVAGVFAFPWSGVGFTFDPRFMTVSILALPVLAGAATLAASIGLSIRARVSDTAGTRTGLGLFAIGALMVLLWAVCSGTVGIGSTLDQRLALPVYAVGLLYIDPYEPWSRWLFDAAALLSIAVLLGFGPKTPLARRALWIGVLAVLADSAWRVGVTLFAGQIPILWRGLSDWIFASGFSQSTSLTMLFVWNVLGALALGFVALFANLPNRDGPHPSLVTIGLAVAGLWLGLQAALLYSVGLFEAMGMEPVIYWANPEYHGMIAFFRLMLLGIGAVTLGLAQWRAGD